MIGKVARTRPRVGNGQVEVTPSLLNSFKLAIVVDRLSKQLNAENRSNSAELFCLYLALARGIDRAVGRNECPDLFVKLKPLLNQISKLNHDAYLHVAVTVLMISVKHACQYGWFPDQSEQFLHLASELEKSFCSEVYSNGATDSLATILTVMSRFYPLMRIGKILCSLEVEPGYGTYLSDFSILKDTGYSLEEKIHLLVIQTEKLETSACIISPPKANFLLNGRGVEKRVNVSLDHGPQFPTDVSRMLQCGSNMIQAIGQFDGHHIVVVAFMSSVLLPENPFLEDFDQTNVLAKDLDSDVIEGPTRIMLNCPISCSRIKIPVKGKSCKHLQCFDFKNYIGINSIRPSWRCPLCNQSCSYTDIRVDRNISKVLQEVGDNAIGAVLSSSGSLKAVLQSDNDMEQTVETILNKETIELQELSIPNNAPTILDLTDDDDDDMDLEDQKPVMDSDASKFPSNADVASNQRGPEFWGNVIHESGSLTSGERLVPNIYANISSVTQTPIPDATFPPQSVVMDPNTECRGLPQARWQLSRTSAGVQPVTVAPVLQYVQQMWMPNISPGISIRSQTPQDATLPVVATSNNLQMPNFNPTQHQGRRHIPDQSLHQQEYRTSASAMSYGMPTRESFRVPQSRIHPPNMTQSLSYGDQVVTSGSPGTPLTNGSSPPVVTAHPPTTQQVSNIIPSYRNFSQSHVQVPYFQTLEGAAQAIAGVSAGSFNVSQHQPFNGPQGQISPSSLPQSFHEGAVTGTSTRDPRWPREFACASLPPHTAFRAPPTEMNPTIATQRSTPMVRLQTHQVVAGSISGTAGSSNLTSGLALGSSTQPSGSAIQSASSLNPILYPVGTKQVVGISSANVPSTDQKVQVPISRTFLTIPATVSPHGRQIRAPVVSRTPFPTSASAMSSRVTESPSQVQIHNRSTPVPIPTQHNVAGQNVGDATRSPPSQMLPLNPRPHFVSVQTPGARTPRPVHPFLGRASPVRGAVSFASGNEMSPGSRESHSRSQDESLRHRTGPQSTLTSTSLVTPSLRGPRPPPHMLYMVNRSVQASQPQNMPSEHSR